MAKNTKGFLCETNDFDLLRRLLRPIYMYGSRSSKDMESDGIVINKKRSIDDFQKRFDLYFNTDNDKSFLFHEHPGRKNGQNRKLMKMKHDRFFMSHNYLAEAYAQHTILPEAIISYVYLLEAFRFIHIYNTNWSDKALLKELTERGFQKQVIEAASEKPSLENLYNLIIEIYNMNLRLCDPFYDADIFYDDVLSKEQFRKQLNSLHELGYLKIRKQGNAFLYEPPFDILGELFNEDMKDCYLDDLDLLSEFFCDHAPLTVPGYFLRETIARKKNSIDSFNTDYTSTLKNRCFIKNSRIQNILDDDTVWTLLSFIRDQKPVNYAYSSHDTANETIVTAFPIKIVSDMTYGRRYLFCRRYIVSKTGMLSKKGEYTFHRIDRIFNVSEAKGYVKSSYLGFLKTDTDQLSSSEIREKLEAEYKKASKHSWSVNNTGHKDINILIHFHADENDVNALMEKVISSIPFGEIINLDTTKGSFDFRVSVRNYADMIPWVAGFGRYAEVDRQESPELYEIILKNSQEALKLYGQSV